MTRASPVTVEWLLDNFEPYDGVSLARCTLYAHYLHHCRENNLDPMNAASFGKLIRSIFVGLKVGSFLLSIFGFLSLCLSFYLCLSFCLSIFLSFYLSVFLSFCLSVFLSFYLPPFFGGGGVQIAPVAAA